MNAIAQATEHLTRFLQAPDQRVFALKGAWGVGKSFFVRKFLKESRDSSLPFVSYASIFGLRTIQEVQDVIRGCIEPARHATAAKVGRKIGSLTSWVKPSVPGLTVQIPDFTNAAFWHLAKSHGLLVVLDDLERAHKDLQIEQVLGLASSLTENAKVKVLLILNEDELEEDRARVIARYREKVIDAELAFRPQTGDLVSEFLHEPALTEMVITCLEASGGANIRLIQRIGRGVRLFREATQKHGIPFDAVDLAQVAKLIWLFHVSPLPLTPELLVSAQLRAFWDRGDEVSDAEKELGELTKKVSVQPNSLDRMVLDYLCGGYFSEEVLKTTATEEQDGQAKREFDRRLQEAFTPYTANFRATEAEATAPVEALLDD